MDYPVIDTVATGKRICFYMKRYHLSVKDLQNYLNLSSVQSIYHWLNGRCLPTVDNLYALSALFNTPIDDIIVGNKQTILKDAWFISYYRFMYYCSELPRCRAA